MAVSLHGGDKLRARLNGLAEKIGRGKRVDVGFLEGATYPDGTPVATIAAINEYGNPARNQPPRPFFRQMIADKKSGWGETFGSLMKASNMDSSKALDLMGECIDGQLKQSINDLTQPPLAPSTIARKGFDKPLIQSGVMVNSVSHEVKGD